tara:strand:- start:389 stop:1144 length:756 start_codon:yes stop_codon:yes gene_type:complete
MKQVSQDMQQWTKSNLTHLGIYECTYNYFNVHDETFMPIPMNYNWYCEYMEKGFDLSVADRLNSGSAFWKDDSVFQAYKKCVGIEKCYKLDLVVKTTKGYEMLILAGQKPLNTKDFTLLNRAFHQVSFLAHRIRQDKPNTLIHLKPVNAIKLNHYRDHQNDTSSKVNKYTKAKFDNIILTPKEQLYIEYTLFNLTHKEIAYKHNCSQTAVRKVISNIKRKLGNEFMPTSQMLLSLNDKGVLSSCTPSVKTI